MNEREDKKVRLDYLNSIDEDVVSFVRDTLSGTRKMDYVTVGFYDDQAAERIEQLTGINIRGCRIVLDVNAVLHIVKRHGEEGKQDHSLQNIEDIARMGYVIANYDSISYDGRSTTGYIDEAGKPSPLIKINKRINGTYYVIEAVNSSNKKKNYVVTAYIKKQKSDP